MATKNPTRLGRLQVVAQEASGSIPAYSNPKSVSDIQAGFTVEAEVFIPNPSRSVFNRESIKSDFFELAPISGDQHGQEFSVRFPINGWSSSLPTTSPSVATSSPSIGLFAAILGGVTAMDPDTGPGSVTTGATTDDVPYTGGQTYSVGSAVGLYDGSSNYEMSFIKDNASNTLELLVAGSLTAADASSIYGSVTCFTKPVDFTCFSMLWQSYTGNSRIKITSAVPTSVSVVFDPRSALMAEVTFMTNTVEDASSGASTLSEFDYSLPIVSPPSGANNARLVFQNSSAGSAFTEMDCEAFTITLTQELTAVMSHGATSGVRDLVVQNRSQEITFSTLYGDKNPFDQTPDGKPFVDLSNPSNIGAIQLAVGTQPGKMFGVLIPKPIMMQVPETTDLNGVFASSFMLKPGDFQNSSSASGDAKASNFRVAFV